jgi:peptide/nickel transport system permease protein
MGRYLIRRAGASLITALIASCLVFFIVRAVPGDVVAQMLGQTGDPVAAKSLRAFFGLDQPAWRQYLVWLWHAVQGDLGDSWVRGQPVASMVGQAFMITLEIAAFTLFLATVVGIPLGVLAGLYEGRLADTLIQGFNLFGLAAPVFWVGLMLLVLVSAGFGWSPPLVYQSPGDSLIDNLQILLLPVLTLCLLQMAACSQFVRQNVVSAFHQDYVRTALAKGVPLRWVFFKHILRNILIPLITFMGLIFIQILGGVVIVESVFAIPGLGRLLLTAIEGRDYPVLQGALLVIMVSALAVNFVIDILYHVIDPRVRLS